MWWLTQITTLFVFIMAGKFSVDDDLMGELTMEELKEAFRSPEFSFTQFYIANLLVINNLI